MPAYGSGTGDTPRLNDSKTEIRGWKGGKTGPAGTSTSPRTRLLKGAFVLPLRWALYARTKANRCGKRQSVVLNRVPLQMPQRRAWQQHAPRGRAKGLPLMPENLRPNCSRGNATVARTICLRLICRFVVRQSVCNFQLSNKDFLISLKRGWSSI